MKHDAKKMRLVRESMGMTQEKLAILSNVSERTVQRAEAGANMRLDTLVDFAAALEIPLSELALEQDEKSGDHDITLRLVRTARELIDDLAKAGVAHFDCEIDPEPDEVEPLLSLVSLIEDRLPNPWGFEQRPASTTLSEKIRLTAEVRTILDDLSARSIGFYACTSWINAQYPFWDVDEGHRYTHKSQPYEKVMTLQIIICRSTEDKIYRKPVTNWGIQQEKIPVISDDMDDDVPF